MIKKTDKNKHNNSKNNKLKSCIYDLTNTLYLYMCL